MIQKLSKSIKTYTNNDSLSFKLNLFYFNIFYSYFASFRPTTVVMIQKLLNSIKIDSKKIGKVLNSIYFILRYFIIILLPFDEKL